MLSLINIAYTLIEWLWKYEFFVNLKQMAHSTQRFSKKYHIDGNIMFLTTTDNFFFFNPPPPMLSDFFHTSSESSYFFTPPQIPPSPLNSTGFHFTLKVDHNTLLLSDSILAQTGNYLVILITIYTFLLSLFPNKHGNFRNVEPPLTWITE